MTSIETSRLLLREWRIEDLRPYARLNADKAVMKYFPAKLTWEESEAHYKRIKDHFKQYQFGLWAAEEKFSGRFMGFIGLQWTTWEAEFTPCVEIGWRLDKKFWRQGFATEGAIACLGQGFSKLDLEEVYSFTPSTNIPSEGVMKKIGMKKVGEFKHPKVSTRSKLSPHVLYKITIDEWMVNNK